MEKYISTKQFAEQAGVHIATVRLWIKSGKLKAVQPFQRSTWRIPASELKRFHGLVESVQDDDIGHGGGTA